MSELAQPEVTIRPPDEWELIFWRDIDYAVRVKSSDYFMDFEVYQVTCWEWSEGWAPNVIQHDTPLYELKDAASSMDTTGDIAQAQKLFHGSVKWDGCSDWAFETQHCMWHTCGVAAVTDLAEALRRIFPLAADRIERWDAEMAGMNNANTTEAR